MIKTITVSVNKAYKSYKKREKQWWNKNYYKYDSAYNKIHANKKSGRNRIKYSLVHLTRKKEARMVYLAFQRALLSTPVPKFLQNIPPRTQQPAGVMRFVRYKLPTISS